MCDSISWFTIPPPRTSRGPGTDKRVIGLWGLCVGTVILGEMSLGWGISPSEIPTHGTIFVCEIPTHGTIIICEIPTLGTIFVCEIPTPGTTFGSDLGDFFLEENFILIPIPIPIF